MLSPEIKEALDKFTLNDVEGLSPDECWLVMFRLAKHYGLSPDEVAHATGPDATPRSNVRSLLAYIAIRDIPIDELWTQTIQ